MRHEDWDICRYRRDDEAGARGWGMGNGEWMPMFAGGREVGGRGCGWRVRQGVFIQVRAGRNVATKRRL